jgi:hypothetical protein
MLRYALSVATLTTALALSAGVTEAQRSSAITISRGSFAVVPYGGYLVTQPFIEGPLNTSLSFVASPLYGLQASLPLAPSASLVAGVGYSSGNLEVGVPVLGGISVGNSSALVMDAAVELRMTARRFSPFVQLGGGAIRREVSVIGVSRSTTDFQVSGGAGVDLPIAGNFGFRLLAKDHYGKADFGSIGELRAATKDIHSLALTGGIRFSF